MAATSAAYQADLFNYCEETHKIFASGADQDAVKAMVNRKAVCDSRGAPPQSRTTAPT
jgi:hypothetical protein